jgi:hypothetical protein
MRLGRAVLFAYAAIGVPAIAALLLLPVLFENLGQHRVGLLSLLIGVAGFFANFDFGVGTAVARFSARLAGRPLGLSRVRRLVRTAVILQLGVGLLLGSLLWASQWLIAAVDFRGDTAMRQEIANSFLLLGLAMPATLATGSLRSGMEGLGRFGVSNVLRAVASLSTFMVPIGVSFFSPRLDMMMLGLFLARMVTLLGFGLLWEKVTRRGRGVRGPLVVKRLAGVLIGYGRWAMLGFAAGGVIVLGIVDRYLFATIVGSGTLFELAVPADMLGRILLIAAGITSVLLPTFSGLFSSTGGLSLSTIGSAVTLMSNHVGPLVLIVLLNADMILGWLTAGRSTAGAGLVLQGFMLGAFVHSLAHVPHAALHGLGLPRSAAMRHVVQLPFYAVASAVLLETGHWELTGLLWMIWATADFLMVSRLAVRSGHLLMDSSIKQWLSPTIWLSILAVCWIAVRSLAVSEVTNFARLSITAVAGLWLVFQGWRLLSDKDVLRVSK